MDDNSDHFILESPQSVDNTHLNSSSSHHYEHPEAQCVVCRRAFSLGTRNTDGLEAISICGECKNMVVDDNEATPVLGSRRHRRRQRGRGSRYGSSESIEDLFSQQFSQLIGLVRQTHDIQAEDVDTTITLSSRGSNSSARFWSRSWRRPISDYDSESIDHGDSLFGETDSSISFYGGDSEASHDVQSLLEREISTHLDYESHNYTDTDIDPMHAGLDQWNSDDQDEDIQWEGVNMEETSTILTGPHVQMQDTLGSPNDSFSSAQNGRWIHWRVRHADLFADLEDLDIPPFVGNSSDDVDARGFEELLEQLAETDGARRGAPPAAVSIIQSLPYVIISKDHEKDGSLVCPVCKEPLSIDSEAKQLPCFHLYHPSCILPWLSARNSCPVCRYELPTDDPEYEQGKENMGGNEIHGIQLHEQGEESSTDVLRGEHAEEGEKVQNSFSREDSNGGTGRGWLFLAAAPIVSIVGIALAFWLQKSVGDARNHNRNTEQNGPHQRHRSCSIADGNRRWRLPF
ncbi:uncharacterized protein M6B38_326295 [Iris pallida]|uniref:RING-type E3 ubiquitin transferase n=1 Tax=Iris pallida TaxID=29817 RepID=A0AAX6H6Z0_IRIPA|nr:uncharacterized protein M6B38_326295 [Iris pallida]